MTLLNVSSETKIESISSHMFYNFGPSVKHFVQHFVSISNGLNISVVVDAKNNFLF